jgi:5'-3' exonuclease
MGIKGLSALLKKFAPDSISQTLLADLPKTTGLYALDVSGYLYASQYNSEHKGLNNHIRDFINIICTMASYGFRVVCVFDGNTKSVSAKQATLNDRTEKINGQKNTICDLIGIAPDTKLSSMELKQQGLAAMKLATDPVEQMELRDALRNFIVINPGAYTDLTVLFDLMGVPYIRAQGEADFVCSALYRAGLIDGVLSEDMDMLTHGVGTLVRGIMSPGCYRNGLVTTYHLPAILAGLELDMKQFRELCILCGCDYCPKVDGIAGIRGLALLKKHGGLETLVNTKVIQVDVEKFQYQRAYEIFANNQEPLPEKLNLDQKLIGATFKQWVLEKTDLKEAFLNTKMKILNAILNT